MYSIIKSFLFFLDPETSHYFTLNTLRFLNSLGVLKFFFKIPSAPCQVMGLTFTNPVGLAAGLDKNGDYIDALAALGFGFIEVGTITRKPQSGNPRPRLFRLTKENAIINRMGFNNKGIEYLVENLKRIKYKGILGINIGKNKETPIENAVDDYRYLFQQVAPYASYVTINISSPNTENLRALQHGELLQNLLSTLKQEQAHFFETHHKYVPLVVKIAPDLTDEALKNMAEIFLKEKIDGVIATNTTLGRVGVEHTAFATESGGVSGKPLRMRSTEIIKLLAVYLDKQIPIIACGGVFSAVDAKEKFAAGAKLVQIYTGLIYEGPGLIKKIFY